VNLYISTFPNVIYEFELTILGNNQLLYQLYQLRMPILTHKLQSDSNLFITSEKLKNKLLNEEKIPFKSIYFFRIWNQEKEKKWWMVVINMLWSGSTQKLKWGGFGGSTIFKNSFLHSMSCFVKTRIHNFDLKFKRSFCQCWIIFVKF
jgi:hypothetical protein